MSLPIRLLIFSLGLILSIIIFELVRRKKFREELSLAWFAVGIAIMSSSVADLLIDPVARILKIGYPPALLFLWVIFFLILALLYFSALISDLKGKLKELSQKMALMEFKLSEMREKDDG